MKHISYRLFALTLFFYFGLNGRYQDVFINGEVVAQGVRPCDSRYEAIKKVVSRYNRPITVLDIGAAEGYFSFRLAYDFKATCVMIEGDTDAKHNLESLCEKNNLIDSIILLKKRITPEDLFRLGECEHFDVVLAFNVIHHFGAKWEKAIKAIFSLGDIIIIETPPEDDKNVWFKEYVGPIERYLKKRGGVVIDQCPRHTSNAIASTYLFEQNKTTILRPYWGAAEQLLKVESTNDLKTIGGITRPQGISLSTFSALNGIYPSRALITKKMSEFEKLGAHDVLIQGNKLVSKSAENN